MSDDLILEQFVRLLDSLPAGDPWPTLNESGFLDLLRSEEEGGAGLALEGLFPLALAAGARPQAAGVIETMVARLKAPEAQAVTDLEAAGVSRAVAAAIAAGLMAGAMEALQATTIEYASTRKQFGREISKFQAIQHQIAVMAQETTAARMAAQGAFVGAPLDVSPLRAAAAKARAGQAAQQVAAIAHAVHGAIGMTQEHHLHRLTGALHRWRLAHGGESGWARELGRWGLARKGGLVELARAM
jgi:hypothetical protein